MTDRDDRCAVVEAACRKLEIDHHTITRHASGHDWSVVTGRGLYNVEVNPDALIRAVHVERSGYTDRKDWHLGEPAAGVVADMVDFMVNGLLKPDA